MDVVHTRDRRPLGWLLAGLGMLSVSTDSLWVRVSEADAIDVAFLVACAALISYWTLGRRLGGRIERRSPLESLRRHRTPLIAAGVLGAASQLSFISAITQTRVANVVAIVSAAPLLTAVFARLALKERVARRAWLAIFATMCGIAMIVASSVGEPTIRGDLLALLAVSAFAVNMTIWRRHPDMSRLVGLSISSVVTIAATSLSASPLGLDLRAYLAIGAMGLCFNPLGRLAHTHATRHAPVSEVALFTPVETVAGTLWAVLFLNEAPRAVTAVGAAVVLAGVFYGTIGAARSGQART